MDEFHMFTQCEAIIQAFSTLGGVHNIKDISKWVCGKIWR
jgi:hypothetical protein